MSESITLKDMIRRVQHELIESELERECLGEKSLFELEKLVLEVSFVATKSTDLKGGFELKVPLFGASVGAAEGAQTQQVQKLTLTLKASSDPCARGRSPA